MSRGKQDPLKFPPGEVRFETMAGIQRRMKRGPYFGYTMGGSSRKYAGCKVAAFDATLKPTKDGV